MHSDLFTVWLRYDQNPPRHRVEERATVALVRMVDRLLAQILESRLGQDWKTLDLKERFVCHATPFSEERAYHLDGELILWAGALYLQHNGLAVRVSRPVRHVGVEDPKLAPQNVHYARAGTANRYLGPEIGAQVSINVAFPAIGKESASV